MFDNDVLYYDRHPRSAVCKTRDGKLIFLVIEGRN